MDVVKDRENIPKLDESQLIQADETRIARVAAPLIGVVALGLTAVLSNTGLGEIPTFNELPEGAKGPVGLGLLLVVAAVIIGVSLITAADLNARGTATAANLALRAQPAVVISPPGVPGRDSTLTVKRKGLGSDEEWTVVSARVDAHGETHLYVSKDDATPTWIPVSDVVAWQRRS